MESGKLPSIDTDQFHERSAKPSVGPESIEEFTPKQEVDFFLDLFFQEQMF